MLAPAKREIKTDLWRIFASSAASASSGAPARDIGCYAYF
ncbi:hypothetical protein Z948_2574 [Sulfitobacter donghicola DSW-25 = KCTC 12864 = JCM 14565]|nr:hypothetical protein Z948_2574 [Sulfitobacter donghicola DSW-25 = KCTC 12864 = JCM 14565]